MKRPVLRRSISFWLLVILAGFLSSLATDASAEEERASVEDPGDVDAGEEIDRDDLEYVDLAPEEPVGFSLRHVTAPITGFFHGGPDYWYKEREVLVDTTPSGGYVDLFYVRRSFQKRFEQAESPVIVVLPPRIKTGSRDSVTIRAFAEGFRQRQVTLPVSSVETEIVINLDPLPNTLAALAHRYFAFRSTLVFYTKESLSFRVQEGEEGFTLILSETAKSKEADASLSGIKSPMLSRAYSQQLGEDLVIKVEFSEEAVEKQVKLRSHEGRDHARDLYMFSIDIIPGIGSGGAVAAAKTALSLVTEADVTGCALNFDSSVRESIGVGDLARALAPRGAFTDPYIRAAMRRLGQVAPNDGAVEFGPGVFYDPAVPIELEAALSEAAEGRGFLALLRSFVAHVEEEAYRSESYRSLIAPELDPMSFDVILERAQGLEKNCLASM